MKQVNTEIITIPSEHFYRIGYLAFVITVITVITVLFVITVITVNYVKAMKTAKPIISISSYAKCDVNCGKFALFC